MNNKITLPVKEELLAAMKVAETSVDAAEYLAQQFESILKKAKLLDECKDILSKVKEFVSLVRFKLISSTQPWFGEIGTISDFHTLQDNLATDAAGQLQGEIDGTVHLDIAISDTAELMRGYSINDNLLDAERVGKLDTLNNAWLAENDIIRKGGVLFESEKGEIKTDIHGQQIPVTASKVKNLISDPVRGLEKYYKDKGIMLTIQQHSYPKQESEKEHLQDIQQAIDAQSTMSGSTKDATIEQETPQSGISSGA